MKDPSNKDDKRDSRDIDALEEIDEDELYTQEKVYIESLTPPIQPVSPGKKYLHVPFNSEKPCVHIKFPFEDQRRRHYNHSMLMKIWNALVCILSLENHDNCKTLSKINRSKKLLCPINFIFLQLNN